MKKLLCLILTFTMAMSLCVNAEAAVKKPKINVLDAKYDEIEVLSSVEEEDTKDYKLLFQYSNGDKWGIIDKNGKKVTDAVYDHIWEYYQGYILVVKDEKVGYLDKNGKQITKMKYDIYECQGFHEGLALVCLNGKKGFINTKGKEVIPLKYDGALNFEDGVAPVCVDGKWGLIDKTGKEILAPSYAQIGYVAEGIGTHITFVDGIAPVKDQNGKWGYIDKKGKEVIAPQFDEAYEAINGFATFVKDNKSGLANRTGIVVEPIYDYIDTYGISSDGYIKVKQNGQYGFIDLSGEVVIKPQYEYAGSFYSGLAPVVIDGTLGYIDKKNKLVIDALFDRVDYGAEFTLGTAVVVKDGKYGVINKKGAYLVKPAYDGIFQSYFGDLYIVNKNGKFGVLDKNGKVVMKSEYSSIFVDQFNLCAEANGITKFYNFDGTLLSKTGYSYLYQSYAIIDGYEVYTYQKNNKMGIVMIVK